MIEDDGESVILCDFGEAILTKNKQSNMGDIANKKEIEACMANVAKLK